VVITRDLNQRQRSALAFENAAMSCLGACADFLEDGISGGGFCYVAALIASDVGQKAPRTHGVGLALSNVFC
jgi:hypothetical protein